MYGVGVGVGVMNPLPVGELVEILNGCPNSDSVAEFLRVKEITGVPGCATRCIISRWVARESGEEITTTVSCVAVWEKGTDTDGSDGALPLLRYPVSGAVKKFILRFDVGWYSDLVDKHSLVRRS